MTLVLEAIYEDGVLKPLEDPQLAEHQRVVLEIRDPAEQGVGASELAAWQEVFSGLSSEEVAEVEAIALDRSQFFGPAR